MKRVIVSFTSYPARINVVSQVVESILKQTVQADRIVLWLSEVEFPNKDDDLTKDLVKLMQDSKLDICWVTENLKSHKKYFYVLQKFSDDIVITIDDDIYYEPTMIETLLESYQSHPKAISARNVHRVYRYGHLIAPYYSWNYTDDESDNVESLDLCCIGAGGVLYPPKCSNADWFNKEQIRLNAENQDDIWLKYQEVRSGIPVVYAKARGEDCVIEGSQKVALMHTNCKTDNDICLKKLSQLFIEDERISAWTLGLQQVEYVLQNKRQVCLQKLEKYKGKDVSIFGAGVNAKCLYMFIKKNIPEINVQNFIVSNRQENTDFFCGLSVLEYSEIENKKVRNIILGVSDIVQKQIFSEFQSKSNHIWVKVDLNAIKQVYRGNACIEGIEKNDINYYTGI